VLEIFHNLSLADKADLADVPLVNLITFFLPQKKQKEKLENK